MLHTCASSQCITESDLALPWSHSQHVKFRLSFQTSYQLTSPEPSPTPKLCIAPAFVPLLLPGHLCAAARHPAYISNSIYSPNLIRPNVPLQSTLTAVREQVLELMSSANSLCMSFLSGLRLGARVLQSRPLGPTPALISLRPLLEETLEIAQLGFSLAPSVKIRCGGPLVVLCVVLLCLIVLCVVVQLLCVVAVCDDYAACDGCV